MKTLKIAALIFAVGSLTVHANGAEVNTEKTKVVWTGKKIGSSHTGEIKLKSGQLEIEGDKISGGEFVMDMNSISNSDIKNEEYKQKLVGHLKSDDFFGVEKYPTASFSITNATAFKGSMAQVDGKLTIKGNTEPISFNVEKRGDVYVANIEIDRSKFDVRFGSKSFFNNLGDNVINDIFTLNVELHL